LFSLIICFFFQQRINKLKEHFRGVPTLIQNPLKMGYKKKEEKTNKRELALLQQLIKNLTAS